MPLTIRRRIVEIQIIVCCKSFFISGLWEKRKPFETEYWIFVTWTMPEIPFLYCLNI